MRAREDDLLVVRGGDRLAKRPHRFEGNKMIVLRHDIEQRYLDLAQDNPMTLDRHCILYKHILLVASLDELFIGLPGYRRCFNYPAQSTPVIDQDLLASHLMDKFPVA